jgi:cyclic-di-GMP-binding protein
MWAGEDSNLRRRCRQIYSLLPLATRAPTLVAGCDGIARHPPPLLLDRLATLAVVPSFDVVSQVDRQEVRNAVDQAQREIGTRFDFKGTNSSIEQAELVLTLRSVSEDRLTALRQVLEEKLVKRKVSLKGLEYGTVEEATQGTVRQTATITVGISSDKAREINKLIKEKGPKGVNSQTQGDSVRVTSKKRDDLQAVMQVLREADLGIPIQFDNRRD